MARMAGLSTRSFRPPRQRRYLLPSILALTVLWLYYHFSSAADDSLPQISTPKIGTYVWSGWPAQQVGDQRASWGALRQVGAKARIKQNLRADKRYLISFSLSGWNNQVIDMLNHVHLAVNSGRIPVVTPFYPHYVHYDEAITRDLPVGRVFDLKRLAVALADTPIVEAHELKRIWGMEKEHAAVVYDGEVKQSAGKWGKKLKKGVRIPPEDWEKRDETLGCWSFYGNFGGEGSAPMDRIGLNLDYTPLPSTLYPGGFNTYPVPLKAAAEHFRQTHTSVPAASLLTLHHFPELARPTVLPDDHLACVDSSYWMQETPAKWDLHGEWRNAAGVWLTVGRHAYFREELQDLAGAALRGLFGLTGAEEIPPFIGVHIRRGDFGPEWMHLTPRHYAYVADAVRRSIQKDLGVGLVRVLVATDEEDPDWLQQLRDFGWYLTQDYDAWMETAADDQWLPIVLDSLILSRGIGFVGPASSTMSILSYLRVKEWNKGVARFIQPHDKVPDGWTWARGSRDASSI